ncbi:MAG: hypothetical protein L0G81_13325 [Ewingella sp.]|nr:hypothetical protein [Ewingella sp.]
MTQRQSTFYIQLGTQLPHHNAPVEANKQSVLILIIDLQPRNSALEFSI